MLAYNSFQVNATKVVPFIILIKRISKTEKVISIVYRILQ